ncbi:MAG: hypothetical protein ACR2QT_02410 [Woeseiaceae bacterium]
MTTTRSFLQRLRPVLIYSALAVVVTAAICLAWLRWDANKSRDDWFGERHGQIETVDVDESITEDGRRGESVRLISNSGLEVTFRIVRSPDTDTPQPILMILGGHRTGGNVVDLYSGVDDRAVVGVDYPYDGPDKVKGLIPIARTIPLARQAFLDTVPALSLVLDWLAGQAWVDKNRIVLVGASLGVPFAAKAAARDKRITGLMLVHGAADNRLWAEVQVARRVDVELLHYPLSNVLNWLAYGPIFDTGANVAELSPRPVLIVGAREDERTPAGQQELLFAAAHEPKRLRYSDGKHVQPNRVDIILELQRILDEEQPFLTQ